MGINGPTLRDVAKRANVSHTAVSLALRGVHGELGISASVRERIFKAVRELGYRPHRIGLALQSRRSGIVGFVVSSNARKPDQLANYQVHPFVVGLTHRLAREDCHVAYFEIRELAGGQDEWPRMLRERFLDGLVVHSGLSAERREQFEQLGIPVIWWDSGVFQSHNCLYRDEGAVGRRLARELLDRGHRRIGYLVGGWRWDIYQRGEPVHYSYAQRYEGYVDELRTAGLDPLRLHGDEPGDIRSQYRVARPTALIGTGADLLTRLSRAGVPWAPGRRGAISVASLDLEKRVPTDAVLGGMLYDRYEAGARAADRLMAMLKEPDHRVSSEKIPPEFREGETIRPA